MRFPKTFSATSEAFIYHGDRLAFLRQIPNASAHLIVTSPPYNIGKTYEKRVNFEHYLRSQRETLTESVRTLAPDGSLCWEVGNHVAPDGEIFPLDIYIYQICKDLGLKLRNRIVWCFEHGLHSSKRLSGRHEAIVWFTKTDDYVFNLDPIRVPQKYPGKKYFKGPKAGQYSCNPLGKNPGDVWVIPNVKNNHVEKTIHPCQFPIELVERLVLSMTNPGDLVIDPYLGVGSAACAAVMHGRRAAGADLSDEYISIAKELSLQDHGEKRFTSPARTIQSPSVPTSSARRTENIAASVTSTPNRGVDSRPCNPSLAVERLKSSLSPTARLDSY